MKDLVGFLASIGVVLMLGLCIVGQVFNIVKLTQCDFDAPYDTEIIRGVGIAVPIVGVVVGYMDIGEENEKDVSDN